MIIFLRNTITRFRNWNSRRIENKNRNRSFRHRRYWRATSKSGTVDLGHYKEKEAIAAASAFGQIIHVDWVNAIIMYDDGTLKGGD